VDVNTKKSPGNGEQLALVEFGLPARFRDPVEDISKTEIFRMVHNHHRVDENSAMDDASDHRN